MAGMQFLTRGGSSPQGKPKVYFCYHPEDLALYLEPVAAELLEKQNCAVWYAQDIQPELSDLEQMQLFVIPVTRRFLTSPNRALEVEYPFAIAHHIPVLPLMQEPGLDTLFNQKCGELQFLDKNIKDPTGISYEEKLEKFLSAVLIGDKLSESIRKAFDAYMFLSYRKKDRRHARRLMELIHQNDFCRDVAIWYDEFLTPGENFNVSIQNALEQSNLFVLTVTPNLVNETNYVMTTEYPMAWQTGKPIVPVELVTTDRATLKEKYTGIPTPAEAHDPAALTRSLQEATKGLALRKNDSPEQDYLMGLAYLSGVDVEVNHARAVQLITGAAETGYQDAITKLVNMYSNGLGVARNYETALHWQERLVRLREQQYRNEPTPTHLYRLTLALKELSFQLSNLFRDSQAQEQCRYALELLEAFPKCSSYPELDREVAFLCLLLGRLAMSANDLDVAKTYLEKAEPIFSRLSHASNYASMSNHVSCLNALGDLYARMGNQEAATSKYNLAEIFGLYVAVLDESAGSSRGHIERVLGEAELYENQGMLQKAEKHLLKHLPTQQRSAEESKVPYDRLLLGKMFFNLARLCKKQNRLSDAETYYLKARDIFSVLAKETDAMLDRRNFAQSLIQLGKLRCGSGRYSEALQNYESALVLLTRLAGESDEHRSVLAENYFYLADLHRLEKRWFKSEACYQRALDLFTALANHESAVQARQGVSLCYANIALQYKQAQQPEQAIAYFQKAISLDRCLPPSDERDRLLASRYEQVGHLYLLTAQHENFRKCVEAAFSIRLQQAKKHRDAQIQEDLGRSYSQMFVLTKNRAYMEKAIEIFTMLCRAYPNESRYREHLALCKNRLSRQ